MQIWARTGKQTSTVLSGTRYEGCLNGNETGGQRSHAGKPGPVEKPPEMIGEPQSSRRRKAGPTRVNRALSLSFDLPMPPTPPPKTIIAIVRVPVNLRSSGSGPPYNSRLFAYIPIYSLIHEPGARLHRPFHLPYHPLAVPVHPRPSLDLPRGTPTIYIEAQPSLDLSTL